MLEDLIQKVEIAFKNEEDSFLDAIKNRTTHFSNYREVLKEVRAKIKEISIQYANEVVSVLKEKEALVGDIALIKKNHASESEAHDLSIKKKIVLSTKLDKDISEVTSKIDLLNGKAAGLMGEITTLKNEEGALRTQNSILSRGKATLESENSTLTKSVEKLRTDEAELTSSIELKKKEYSNLLSEIAILNSRK